MDDISICASCAQERHPDVEMEETGAGICHYCGKGVNIRLKHKQEECDGDRIGAGENPG